jgi:hypothetical protein
LLKGDEAPEDDSETHAQEMSGEISKSIDDDDEDSRIEEV